MLVVLLNQWNTGLHAGVETAGLHDFDCQCKVHLAVLVHAASSNGQSLSADVI